MGDATPRVIFEQPLKERVRTLLRLEFLFETVASALEGRRVMDSQLAVEALIDIQGVLARGDLRSELITELDRIATSLSALQDHEEVDQARLAQLLASARQLATTLRGNDARLGQALREDELLAAVAQRSGVGAGALGFDVPAFQAWLAQPPGERRPTLERWYAGFEDIRQAALLVLRTLRESSDPQPQQARGGVWQQKLDGRRDYHLVRVLLPSGSPVYPEISGSRHYVIVRFMSQPDTRERPVQRQDDVEFELQLCGI